jgi:thioredoxin reductase (NADPH)
VDHLVDGGGRVLSDRRRPRVRIVGGGPGGMAAGIWCHRLGLDARIFEGAAELGGQLRHVFSPVPDYPGIPVTDGPDLARRIADHVSGLGVPVELECSVERLDADPLRLLLADGRGVEADAVILAGGVARRRLGVPGEARHRGHGLSYSVSKELGSIHAREVAVVGGGDAAFEGALLLTHECERVHLIHRVSPRARPDFRAAVVADPRIVVHAGERVVGVEGESALTGVRLAGGGRVPAERVFVRIGVEPRIVDAAFPLARDEHGYLRVDRFNRCAPGVYAVGDVCSPDAMSVSVAVGHAMIACKHVQSGWL